MLYILQKNKTSKSDHFLRQYNLRLKYQYRRIIRQYEYNTIIEKIENSENKP